MTSIEWLESKMYVYGINPHAELFEEAKSMEKQQIVAACDYGIGLYINDPITAEDYYNETFKSE